MIPLRFSPVSISLIWPLDSSPVPVSLFHHRFQRPYGVSPSPSSMLGWVLPGHFLSTMAILFRLDFLSLPPEYVSTDLALLSAQFLPGCGYWQTLRRSCTMMMVASDFSMDLASFGLPLFLCCFPLLDFLIGVRAALPVPSPHAPRSAEQDRGEVKPRILLLCHGGVPLSPSCITRVTFLFVPQDGDYVLVHLGQGTLPPLLASFFSIPHWAMCPPFSTKWQPHQHFSMTPVPSVPTYSCISVVFYFPFARIGLRS